MVLKFSELKELVNKLEKRIPKYEQDDTRIEVILSSLDNNSIKIEAKGFVGKIEMNYCGKESKVIIKQGITDDYYYNK